MVSGRYSLCNRIINKKVILYETHVYREPIKLLLIQNCILYKKYILYEIERVLQECKKAIIYAIVYFTMNLLLLWLIKYFHKKATLYAIVFFTKNPFFMNNQNSQERLFFVQSYNRIFYWTISNKLSILTPCITISYKQMEPVNLPNYKTLQPGKPFLQTYLKW